MLLAYALLLLLFCSVMTASRLGELAEDICHAFARSAGRLVTSAALWVCFQSAIVYTYHRRNWPLLLCQLWGTTCKDPGTVLWQYSYSIYLAVLLPLLVWCGGLQIVVAGKFVSAKITAQTSARRLVVVNVLTVLVLLSTYTVKENFALGCKQGCPEEDDVSFFDQKPGARSVMSVRVLLVAGSIPSDMLAARTQLEVRTLELAQQQTPQQQTPQQPKQRLRQQRHLHMIMV